MQRIIFLDVDGVLNSLSFHKRADEGQNLIDPHTVELLKALVNASGARLVLTSSWRDGWDRHEEACGADGLLLNEVLRQYGLKIMDKTGRANCSLQQTRCREILRWLRSAREPVSSFVILDDGDYEWERYGLDRFLVRTDFMDDGLKDCHIPKAIDILEHPPVSVRRLLLQNFLKGR